MKNLIIVGVLLIVCLFTISANQAPAKWEYKVESGVNEKKINSLAAEGWELAGTGNFGGPLAAPYLILKRAK